MVDYKLKRKRFAAFPAWVTGGVKYPSEKEHKGEISFMLFNYSTNRDLNVTQGYNNKATSDSRRMV